MNFHKTRLTQISNPCPRTKGGRFELLQWKQAERQRPLWPVSTPLNNHIPWIYWVIDRIPWLVDKFRSACQGLKPYIATVDHVASGFCVYLQIHPTAEVFSFFSFLALSRSKLICTQLILYAYMYVCMCCLFQAVETSAHCKSHFGSKSSTRKLLCVF